MEFPNFRFMGSRRQPSDESSHQTEANTNFGFGSLLFAPSECYVPQNASVSDAHGSWRHGQVATAHSSREEVIEQQQLLSLAYQHVTQPYRFPELSFVDQSHQQVPIWTGQSTDLAAAAASTESADQSPPSWTLEDVEPFPLSIPYSSNSSDQYQTWPDVLENAGLVRQRLMPVDRPAFSMPCAVMAPHRKTHSKLSPNWAMNVSGTNTTGTKEKETCLMGPDTSFATHSHFLPTQLLAPCPPEVETVTTSNDDAKQRTSAPHQSQTQFSLQEQLIEVQKKMAQLQQANAELKTMSKETAIVPASNQLESLSFKREPGASMSRKSDRMQQESIDNLEKKVHKKSSASNIWKDADRPKRPLTAYNIFFQHERARLLGEDISLQTPPSVPNLGADEKDGFRDCAYTENAPAPCSKRRTRIRRAPHNKMSFENLAQIIGKNWKETNKETRAIFQALADKDKKRYFLDKEAYLKRKRERQENG